MYGNGVYFACTASTSAKYALPDHNGYRYMYYCKVLTGEYTTGQSGLCRPPPKSFGEHPEWYDSVVDDIHNPSMFVIFNDTQALPEYLIIFR